MDALLQDLRYGLRMLKNNRASTVIAVITLALGIGATTAMFSIIYCAVMDAFPFADVYHLVMMVAHDTRYSGDNGSGWISASELMDYQEQSHVFDIVFGQSFKPLLLTGRGEPMPLQGALVTADFFRGMGVPPLLGRSLGPEDCKPGAPAVAVLVYDTWRSKFNADPRIVGQTLNLNHQLTTVVGVMPPRFNPHVPDFFLPVPLSRSGPPERQTHFELYGHLKPGISIEQATADVAILDRRFARAYPKDHPKQLTNSIELLTKAGMAGQQVPLYFLMGAVCLLQVIACVNVANLLLARATTREREIAIRASLGAGRVRLIRQFLAESLLIALTGACLGCLIAWKGLPVILAMIPNGVYFWPSEAIIRINGPVLLFNVGLALICTLLCGMAPALRAAGKRVQDPLKESGQRVGESRGHYRLRHILVANEIALSLVLLTGAGLLIRTFFAMRAVQVGYNPDNVLFAVVALPEDQYKTREQRSHFTQELLRRLRGLPGVTSAAVGFVPWGGVISQIEISGKQSAGDWRAEINLASDRYFETLEIPMLQGRAISEEDFADGRKVAVVNRAFVAKYFGMENPLGRQVTLAELRTVPDAAQPPVFEIVGVVANTSDYQMMTPQPAVYVTPAVLGASYNQLLVRTVGKPTLMTNQVQRELAMLDKDLSLIRPQSLRDRLNDYRFAKPRFMTLLTAVFAALGLTLVSIGIYSVLSYSVSQRTQEIGVRMALGAQAGDVRRMVVVASLRWVTVGIAIGVPVAIALVKLFRGRIWAVKSPDPLILAAAGTLVIAVGLIASYLPARRATKVDPMVALRYE
jgi:putative ABC transport system permease protein